MGLVTSSFKRKRIPDDTDEDSPKVKRIKLGCQPIDIGYKVLFKEGRDSDIDVEMLGKIWKLHQSFIMQSPYFANILETKKNVSKLKCVVSDTNINETSIELCFGVLYGHGIDFIQENNVLNIAATASFLQLSVIIDKVEQFLVDCDLKNAVKRYYLAEKYNLENVCNYIYNRLLICLIPHGLQQTSTFLKDFKLDLLERLLKDPDLVVQEDDFDLYQIMKKWVEAVGSRKNKTSTLRQSTSRAGKSFLETDDGQQYVSLFKILNLPNLLSTNINHTTSLKEGKIIPISWIESAMDKTWKIFLNYYDHSNRASAMVANLERCITPVQEANIVLKEKHFQEQPNRLFKRFTFPLTKCRVTQTLNGCDFVISHSLETNTVDLKMTVKKDIPHILVPTLLYVKYSIFDNDSAGFWKKKQKCRSDTNKTSTSTSTMNDQPSSSTSRTNTTTANTSIMSKISPIIYTNTELMYVLPFAPSGINRTLYHLRRDITNYNMSIAIKFIPYVDLKSLELI